MSKGCTRPVSVLSVVVETDQELVDVQHHFGANRKLTKILRSKATTDTTARVGDFIEVLFKRDRNNRGKWLTPRTVFSINRSSDTVTVPTSNGRSINASFKDVSAALAEDVFAMMVRESINNVDREIASALDDYTATLGLDSATNAEWRVWCYDDYDNNLSSVTPSIEDRVDISWITDSQFNLDGVTVVRDGIHQVTHDDDDVKILDMSQTLAPRALVLALQQSHAHSNLNAR